MPAGAAGETIEGDKILFECGKIAGPHPEGGQQRGTFGLNFYARVQRPLKRSTTNEPRFRSSLRGKSGRYQCDDLKQDRDKVPCGAHRCYQGVLKGNAQVSVTVPA